MRHPDYPSTACRGLRPSTQPSAVLQHRAQLELGSRSQNACTSISQAKVAELCGRCGLVLLFIIAIVLRSLW